MSSMFLNCELEMIIKMSKERIGKHRNDPFYYGDSDEDLQNILYIMRRAEQQLEENNFTTEKIGDI